MSYITIASIISLEFPENNEVYQGYLNMALGMGFCVGPALAAILVRWFDYMGTNFIFAALILIIGLGGVFSLPARINEDHSQENDTGETDTMKKSHRRMSPTKHSSRTSRRS